MFIETIKEQLEALKIQRQILKEELDKPFTRTRANHAECDRIAKEAYRLRVRWAEVQASISTLEYVISEFNLAQKDNVQNNTISMSL